MNFTFQVVDTTGANADLVPQIGPLAAAAAGRLIAILGGTATLQVRINIAPTPTGTANGASATSSFVKTVNGITVYQQGAAAELLNGVDPNGAAADIVINIDPNYMRNSMQFDPTPADSGADLDPARGDLMSVIVHELQHGLAFSGWRDANTGALPANYMSTYDQYINPATFVFNGPWTTATLGQGIPLTRGNINHYGNPIDAGSALLDKGLENGIVWRNGYRYEIGLEDIVVMLDTGVPLKAKLGTPGNDTLSAALHPIVLGGRGNDTVQGSLRSDYMLSGGVGNDRINGAAGNDKIEGGPGADILRGDAGNDNIVGGWGRDIMTGGIGRDVFVFEQAPRYSHLESGVIATTRDIITDFVRGQDKIDISMILSAPLAFMGTGALTGAGQVHYKYFGTATIVEISTDADAAAELSLQLSGRYTLAATDFIL